MASVMRRTVDRLIHGRLSLLTLSVAVLLAVPQFGTVYAQADAPPSGAVVRVVNTDGQRLNVRAGPSTGQPVVAQLDPGATATVTGAAQSAEGTRWLPIRTSDGKSGWVSAQYVQVVSTPTPTPTPTRLKELAASPPPSQSTAPPPTATPAPGKPLTVEAKLKFPEVQGREQEITVWVTRDGAPVPGVAVTVESSEGDGEDVFRQLDPTDEHGRTRRSFDVRREKGTVELKVQAVAPDGGEGQVIVSYFRR